MKQVNQTSESGKVYKMATNRTIAILQTGIIPWRANWAASGLPKNLINGKPFRGANVWLLAMLGYKQNYFLTLKQLKELGGTVKDGEKGNIALFTQWITDKKTAGDENSKKSILRFFTVYNIEQCLGIPPEKIPSLETPADPIAKAEKIVAEMPLCPPINFENGGPFYNQQDDYIDIPLLSDFPSGEAFYAAVFRELVHCTAHANRLSRNVVVAKNERSPDVFSLEQLTADIATSYLLSFAGFEKLKLDVDNTYAIKAIEKLKKDSRIIVYASAQAQRAVEYILNISAVSQKQLKEVEDE